MIATDSYAYKSRLRKIHPAEKAAFSLITMTIALLSRSITANVIIFMVVSAFIVKIAGIEKSFYIKMLSIPISFLLLSTIALIVSVNYGEVLSIKLEVSQFPKAVTIFVKSMTAISCLYFLSLTTALTDIISMLKHIKVPAFIIEVMVLIYRFIFILMGAAEDIHISQASRCGYSSLKNSFNSLAKLVAMVFVKAYVNSRNLYISLASRGYDGSLNVLDEGYQINKRNIIAIIIIDLIFLLISFLLGGCNI